MHLSRAQARRIAIAAQGLDRPRPARPTRAHVDRVIARLGLLQIDAVNVLARAHYMPLFSRLGAYDPALLNAAWLGRKRSCFEYWGHEASILPYDAHPLLRWRMAGALAQTASHARWVQYAKENRAFLDDVLAEVRVRGPLGASELTNAGERRGSWWGWSDGKLAMEFLFKTGELTTAARRGFERLYDLPDRVHPAHVLDVPTPSQDDAVRALAARALSAMGVATVSDIADYYRLPPAAAKNACAALIEAGGAVSAAVEGWRNPALLDPAARTPRRIEACALLSPFDPLIWNRARVERVFGFDYRIEIYVPAPQRRYGYYVLPFLMNDALAARVDLKADRAESALVVQAAHLEPGADPLTTAPALAAELEVMRAWLGLDRVKISRRGDFAAALRRAAIPRAGAP
ncbi:MAG: winged helix-turn-helix domain-containing protein [Alphaproteobacteria bacterium]|nr:winged helix-turn-helix domain-containing protein [Alphaproteobacteria bacterium]